MKRAVFITALLGLLGACASGDPAPQGALDFGPPPEGFVEARPVEVDGRLVQEDELGRGFFLEEGAHRLLVVPKDAGEDAEPLSVGVEVEAGVRRFVALRATRDGRMEVVAWKDEALQ